MIWRGLRNYLLAEFLAWVAFLVLGLLLGVFGGHYSSRRVSEALVLIWFALFLGIYKILHDRRKQRG